MFPGSSIPSALLTLVGIPLLIGSALPGPGRNLGTRWWFGTIIAGLTVIVGHAAGAPRAMTLAAVIAVAAVGIVRGRRWVAPSRDWTAAVTVLLLLAPALAQCLSTLIQPVAGYDGIVIWYSKTKALFAWQPMAALPFARYPNMGPAQWFLNLAWAGEGQEHVGRLVFVLASLAWIWALRELWPAPMPWSSVVVVPIVGLVFMDVDPEHTSGYQDAFLMATAAMACTLITKVLTRDSGAGGASTSGSPRQDITLAALFAGSLGLIKQEGLFLGLILVSVGALSLLGGADRDRRRALTGFLWPALALYAALALLWPLLVSLHGMNPLNIQHGDTFTVGSVLQAFGQFWRWPLIAPYFAAYVRDIGPALTAAGILSLAGAWLAPHLRRGVQFLWGVLVVHLAFVFLVFLSTRADLGWHLESAFARLAGQNRFVLAVLLSLTAVSLIELALARTRRLGATARRRAVAREGAYDPEPASEVPPRA